MVKFEKVKMNNYNLRTRKIERPPPNATCKENLALSVICAHEWSCETKYPLKCIKSSVVKVESRVTNNKGNGLYSIKKIDKGSVVIMNSAPDEFTKTTYSVVNENNDLMNMHSLIAVANHSCSPNCKLARWQMQKNGEIFFGLVAKVTIHKNIELTFDYGLHETKKLSNSPLGMETCLCGSKDCRGTIGGRRKKK